MGAKTWRGRRQARMADAAARAAAEGTAAALRAVKTAAAHPVPAKTSSRVRERRLATLAADDAPPALAGARPSAAPAAPPATLRHTLRDLVRAPDAPLASLRSPARRVGARPARLERLSAATTPPRAGAENTPPPPDVEPRRRQKSLLAKTAGAAPRDPSASVPEPTRPEPAALEAVAADALASLGATPADGLRPTAPAPASARADGGSKKKRTPSPPSEGGGGAPDPPPRAPPPAFFGTPSSGPPETRPGPTRAEEALGAPPGFLKRKASPVSAAEAERVSLELAEHRRQRRDVSLELAEHRRQRRDVSLELASLGAALDAEKGRVATLTAMLREQARGFDAESDAHRASLRRAAAELEATRQRLAAREEDAADLTEALGAATRERAGAAWRLAARAGLERRRTLETRAKLRRVVADHAREMRCALATIDRVADKADAARARPAPPRGERREEEALEPEGWSAAWAWVAEAARPTIADEDAETPDAVTPNSDVATPPSDAEGTVHVEAAVRRVAPSPSPRVGVDAATSPPPAARRSRRGDEPSAFESEVRMETLRAELAGSVAAELRRELEPETRATLRDAVAAELRAELAGPVAAELRKSLRAELAGSVAEELRESLRAEAAAEAEAEAATLGSFARMAKIGLAREKTSSFSAVSGGFAGLATPGVPSLRVSSPPAATCPSGARATSAARRPAPTPLRGTRATPARRGSRAPPLEKNVSHLSRLALQTVEAAAHARSRLNPLRGANVTELVAMHEAYAARLATRASHELDHVRHLAEDFAEDFAASVFSPEAKGRASEPLPLATRGVGDAATTERPAAVAAVVVPPTSPATAARKETPQPPREPPRERSMWELWYR